MKRSGICPKCSNNRLLHVTQVADRVGELGGGRIEHGFDDARAPGQFFPWRIARLKNPDAGSFATNVAAAGFVEAFICRACGLTELYTRDPESIDIDGDLVQAIDGPPSFAPYR